jgi:hypothetical protein
MIMQKSAEHIAKIISKSKTLLKPYVQSFSQAILSNLEKSKQLFYT